MKKIILVLSILVVFVIVFFVFYNIRVRNLNFYSGSLYDDCVYTPHILSGLDWVCNGSCVISQGTKSCMGLIPNKSNFSSIHLIDENNGLLSIWPNDYYVGDYDLILSKGKDSFFNVIKNVKFSYIYPQFGDGVYNVTICTPLSSNSSKICSNSLKITLKSSSFEKNFQKTRISTPNDIKNYIKVEKRDNNLYGIKIKYVESIVGKNMIIQDKNNYKNIIKIFDKEWGNIISS